MNILRTVGMAFALYSRIPMPRLDWESESRKYTLYAFPLVGGPGVAHVAEAVQVDAPGHPDGQGGEHRPSQSCVKL